MPSKLAKAFFVVATDTDAGKTYVTNHLIKRLQHQQFKVIGCKPIACGLNAAGDNDDVLSYQRINSLPLLREQINPLCFPLPVSPNIAASAINEPICLKRLGIQLKLLRELPVDYVFYESIGGWKVPINEHETTIDLAIQLAVPIIFVVGMRVGCLNHALLTWDAICKENIITAGWVANIIAPETPAMEQHILTLKHWISAPYLGTLPFQENNTVAESYLKLELLI
ncbi:MAG: dethiobiotin synthase [Gammaproteobacteria bacterium]|nr:dethiobiotin synthase [Gammaproteobacteria bacterium]